MHEPRSVELNNEISDDMATFGLLYQNEGEFKGARVLSSEWVSDSLERYSNRVNVSGSLPGITSRYGYFRDLGYGYGWGSARVGAHHFHYASGHGGNLIVLLDDLDMIIVTTADPLYDAPAGAGWKRKGAIIELVGKFIKSLPRK